MGAYLTKLLKDSSGASAIEMGLIASLIVLAMLGYTADEIVGMLADMRVADLLPDRPLREIPVLTVRDTTMEAAALMAEERIHMVAVTRDKRYVGCVTVSALLRHLLVDFVDDGAEE